MIKFEVKPCHTKVMYLLPVNFRFSEKIKFENRATLLFNSIKLNNAGSFNLLLSRS